MIKQSIKNFFKRSNAYLICLGLFILGVVVSAFIFFAGAQLIFSVQPRFLIDSVEYYFFNQFQIKDIYEVLNLSIFSRIYNDIMVLAGDSAQSVTSGLFCLLAICIFIVFVSYKSSVALVLHLNKKKISNSKTKTGIKPISYNLFISLVFSILLTFLMKVWIFSGIILAIIYVFVDSVQLILTIQNTYFSYLSIKKMFHNKTILKIMGLYIGWEIVFFIIAFVLGFISPIISFIFAIPLLAYNECNINYTVVTHYKEKI